MYTNTLIKDFLSSLLDVPESEKPVIILQADEGPYPARFELDYGGFDWATASDEELLMKFGVLQAMHLPGPEGARPLRQDMTLVDTYPEVFNRYFGTAIDFPPGLSFSAPYRRPYDLTDITQRLDEAAARYEP